jgi:YidC/Oxa1 family membrane protein insertase
MDRKTLLTISLCFLIFALWQKFYIEPRLPQQTVVSSQGSPANPAAPPSASSQATLGQAAPIAVAAKQVLPVNLSTGSAKVSSANQTFTGWDLKSYRLGIAPEAAAVDLKSVTNHEGEMEIAFELPELGYLTGVQGRIEATPQGVIWSYEDANLKIVRETVGSEAQAFVDVKYHLEFKAKKPSYAYISLVGRSVPDDKEAQDRSLLYWTNNSLESAILSSDVPLKEVSTPVKWVGVNSRYFLMTLVSSGAIEPRALLQPAGAHTGRISMVFPVSGQSMTIPLRAYFGPKELNLLSSVEPSLDHAVDFGWFTAFAYPLLRVMKWFYEWVHNWGVAIILLTILVKILTFPLTYKSMKSMKQMAKLQPQLQKLREKYKDDKEALNREMLTFMRSNGYNPVSGCLPMLIQMPIFFALYRVLYSSIELYHAPFWLWIRDLSDKDPYYVTPVLLTLTMYIQQKMMPNTATDPAQQKMMQFMPIMFGAFMLTLPSGLTIYMLVNALTSIVQQIVLNRKLDDRHVSAVAASAR